MSKLESKLDFLPCSGEASTLHRKRYFVAWLVLVLSVFVSGISTGVFATEVGDALAVSYGAESNPTGDPVGGGARYSHVVTSGDYTVTNAEELIQALAQARPGEVIYVAPTASIDLTGKVGLQIREQVTLAGNRGENGSQGPLISCNEYDTYGLFKIVGDKARITGLRLRGPDPDILDGTYVRPNSKAMSVEANQVEVDNNEIYNWSYGGVSVENGAQNVYVHHNSIHHVQRNGLGYPVVVNKGTALIEANVFDYYRHAIAGTGYIGTGYEARYNLVLPNAISHAFDMHGGADYCPKRTGTKCTDEELHMAGEFVNIHHNTFQITKYPAILLRGVPRESTQVHHNWFYTASMTAGFGFKNFNGGNSTVRNNIYGSAQKLVEEQVKPDLFIRKGVVSGEGQVVALAANGRNASFGFVSPQGGTLVQGDLVVDVQVDLTDAFSVSNINIYLDDRVIYSGKSEPPQGKLIVNTLELNDGSHVLSVSVSGGNKITLSESVSFSVRNWWTLTDELLPPTVAGWFGQINRDATSDKSDGWQYSNSAPTSLSGDENRLVPTSANQWLTWQTPNLQEVIMTFYSENDNLPNKMPGLHVLISVDNQTWTPLSVDLNRIGNQLPGGWHAYELSSDIPVGTKVQYLRLQFDELVPLDTLQLDLVKCKGYGNR